MEHENDFRDAIKRKEKKWLPKVRADDFAAKFPIIFDSEKNIEKRNWNWDFMEFQFFVIRKILIEEKNSTRTWLQKKRENLKRKKVKSKNNSREIWWGWENRGRINLRNVLRNLRGRNSVFVFLSPFSFPGYWSACYVNDMTGNINYRCTGVVLGTQVHMRGKVKKKMRKRVGLTYGVISGQEAACTFPA